MEAAYYIPEVNFDLLTAAIAKLSKRAQKLGSEPISISLTGQSRMIPVYTVDDCERRQLIGHRKEIEILLSGATPKLNGWQFLATIQHDAETGRNVVATVPGTEGTLPAAYRTSDATCDHCKQDRQRKDTYVVHHEDGRFAQVGRTCLKDFTGHQDPHGVAKIAELLAEAGAMCGEAGDEDCFGSGRGECYWNLAGVLAKTMAVTREFGWVSATEAKNSYDGKQPTKHWVEMMLRPKSQFKLKKTEVTEADYTLAEEIINWVKALPAAEVERSDYLWNLQSVAEKEVASRRTLGLACSMPGCYSKELAKRAERLVAGNSKYFGEVGKRELFTLTVMDSRIFEGDYGATTLVTYADKDGNRAKWWASGGRSFPTGETMTVKATVKGHEEYKDVQYTVLSRVSSATDKEVVAAQKARQKAV